MLHRLLLLPLLSPLLVTVLVAALNPSPSVALRLLTWQTASLPIGLWMAIAAGGGAALSASATALALHQGERTPLHRIVRRREERQRQAWTPPWGDDSDETPSWPAAATTVPPVSPAPAGPSRAPGEPAPTVSVPYRVLHRPEGEAPRPFRPEPAAAVVTSEGDWGESDGEEW
ncbi:MULTISPECIES: hypothetical protein [unclassified Cyanobium]|uniref:hypothetical protein n=1 Tax=unclassified Cyanobium TaxID=2627006 RepID=UPI0020CEF8FA|nr:MULTISPECIES: hypothetical protein [unclassified Cyanobium]MCP9833303.1 hypothetical protein [Cyanobium sp. La Preciosa 7G6]MCP9935834.1 hypothetical protein [Cyanobium sp. Aljojuca 7A6]